MARRKATTGQLVLVGAIAVGLGYLLGTWALGLLIKDAPAPQPKLPEVVDAEGEEFSQNVAEVPKGQIAPERSAEQVPQQNIPAAEETATHWRVVIGDFSTREQLEAAAEELKEAGFEVLMKGSGPYFIQMGVFQEKQRADALVEQLRSRSYFARVEGITL